MINYEPSKPGEHCETGGSLPISIMAFSGALLLGLCSASPAVCAALRARDYVTVRGIYEKDTNNL
ncbi:MAG: hypothetical protein LBD55_04345 [Treponema sp.]|nr:hypothetical protein [Treponema sp.]